MILQAAPVLHHVGIVQPSMEDAEAYMALFGQEEDYRGWVEAFSCWCVFLRAPEGGAAVELVIPEGGPLERFNKGAGGLHHYALETPDLAALQDELARRDVRMLLDEPTRGAGDFLCNFVHPVSTRGVVVEYVQLL